MVLYKLRELHHESYMTYDIVKDGNNHNNKHINNSVKPEKTTSSVFNTT